MRYQIIPVTDFEQNCTLLWCEKTLAAAIIDPGGDLDLILSAVAEQKLKPEKILLTHGHIDHTAAAPDLASQLRVPIVGPHQGDLFWLQQLPAQARMFGLPHAIAFEPDRWLQDGDKVGFGEQELEVIHCPGHTPGHVIFYHRASQLAVVGDVLFRGSIGRTDFPLSDHQTLLQCIRQRLWLLGDQVRFIPGHGPGSTFGHERRTNPFVADGI